MPVQLRLATRDLTSEDYVSRQGWREANLERCPLHPEGGCGFERHGTYERKRPEGARVARWYCRKGQCTFSLLPDCLAAQLPGTLVEVEEVVLAVEKAPGQERAVDMLRTDIELPGALRWVRRRLKLVRAALVALVGLLPATLASARPPTIVEFRRVLGSEPVLVELREVAAEHLAHLPPPLGFGPRPGRPPPALRHLQHRMGTDRRSMDG